MATLTQRITVKEFLNLLATISPQDLATIDINMLPETLPEDLIDNAPQALRDTLEDIVFELNTREINLRMEIEQAFGADIAEAYATASDHNESPVHRHFDTQVNQLISLHQRWEQQQDQALAQQLLPAIRKLDKLVPDYRADSRSYWDAYLTLKQALVKAAGQDEQVARFEQSIQYLKQRLGLIEFTLGRYFYLRLSIIGREMQRLERRVKHSDQQVSALDNDIDVLSRQIKHAVSQSSLTDTARKDMIHHIKQQISQLQEEKQQQEVMVLESDLTGWLDVLIDSAVTPVKFAADQAQANLKVMTSKTQKSLFHLLQRYCQQQEQGAERVSKSLFAQVDPESTVKFMLHSEQFIVDYFARKKDETIECFGAMSKNKLVSLKDLEKNLLAQLQETKPLRDYLADTLSSKAV